MTQLDLGPLARRMSDVVSNVSDDQMKDPTPCTDMTVGDLIDHVTSFAIGFTLSAKKEIENLERPPKADAANLAPDWRTRLPQQLDNLAEAWRNPSAWTGMTKAGGLDFPGETCGLIAVDELIVHGWDLARATGQAYDTEPALIDAAMGFVKPLAESGNAIPGLFGVAVPVPETAPPLDRLVGMTGRDPGWTPPS